jgi:uncharacterized RDD family membrane protein YckC
VGIRITKPGGEPIDLREALLRSSVDMAFGLFFATLEVYAISQVNADAYLNAEYMEKSKLIMQFYPVLYKSVDILRAVWYCSEMIVLLFNKRKRALHDFIAGTVVIHKEFAYRQEKLSRTDKLV